MKKYLPIFLISFIFLFLFSFLTKAAQSNNDISSIMSQGSVRSCLKRVAGGHESHPTSGKMIMTATINLSGSCLSQNGCQIWLHNSGNDDIDVTNDEIKACKNGTKTHNCDSAHMDHLQKEADSQVNVKPGWHQVTNFTILSSKKGETYIAINNNDKKVLGETTATTVPQGDVKISVSDRYAGHVSYSYYAIGDANTTTSSESGAGDVITPEQHDTQQESTLNMTIGAPTQGTQTQKEGCVTLYWDPFGRVFDAKSLEPMAGVDVTLLDSKGVPAVISGPFGNWDTTKVDNGVYNILIDKEADYQLKVNPPQTHLFTTKTNLQQNYSLVYSDIYLPGDIFHEAPMPEIIPKDFDYSKYHHDIPLMPKGDPYRVDPVDVFVIKSSIRATDMDTYVSYSGKATFPKAKICMVNELTKEIIGNCVYAEKYGNFTINVDKNIIPQETLLFIANKVDLTAPIIISNSINTENIDLGSKRLAKIDPILNYIEGYSYDLNGKILPGAKVVIKLKDGDIPFYSVTADDKGFFKIYKKNLPFAEYYIEINGRKISTSVFIKDNHVYLYTEKLNLIKSTRDGQQIVYQKNDRSSNSNLSPKQSDNKPLNKAGQGSQTISIQLLIIVVLIISLLLAAIGLVLYIKSKK